MKFYITAGTKKSEGNSWLHYFTAGGPGIDQKALFTVDCKKVCRTKPRCRTMKRASSVCGDIDEVDMETHVGMRFRSIFIT